jgi:hypothetical protein
MRVPDRTKRVTYTKILETRKYIIDHRATTSNQAFNLGFCEKETIKMMRGDEDTIRSQRERERGQGLRGDEDTIRSQRERERERGQGLRGDEDTIRSQRERERERSGQGETKIRSDHREREGRRRTSEPQRRLGFFTFLLTLPR